jgi:dihydrofolate synthase / folylpolyglutamate synthase
MNHDEQMIQLLETLMNKECGQRCLPSHLITQALDFHLGEPSQRYPIVHVTGTNGKGSVVCKIACAYQHAGYKVGVFTSPHIHTVRERIQINEEMIPTDALEKYSEQVLRIAQDHALDLHFFEMMTVVALQYFADQKVDLVVLEVGIGGLIDATNFITPVLSIITSISLDHTTLLGPTLEEIALQKAGIIKKGIPVVLGPSVHQKNIFQQADAQQAQVIAHQTAARTFNEENTATAKLALRYLTTLFPLSEESIEKGVLAVPSCRFEVVTLSHPSDQIVFDVAHNPDGFKKLIEAIHETFGPRELRFLLGMSRRKEIEESLKALIAHAHHIYLAPIAHFKLLPPQEIQDILYSMRFYACSFKNSLTETWLSARQESSAHHALLVVCGSFYVMHDIKQLLAEYQKR